MPERLSPAVLVWINSLCQLEPPRLAPTSPGPAPRIERIEELNDGIILGEIVAAVDPAYFRPITTSATTTKALRDNWVLRFNNLKRLYKLLIRYYEDVLHTTTTNLPTPNLPFIAKNEETYEKETCVLVGLILAIVVKSSQKQVYVDGILGLEQWVQREIMWSIEEVTSKTKPIQSKAAELKSSTAAADADTEFYEAQHERSRLVLDKETLATTHEQLLLAHSTLQEDHEAALKTLRTMQAKEVELNAKIALDKSVKEDAAIKVQFDKLRSDLNKAENQLGASEQTVEDQSKLVEELSHKVTELTPRAEEATRLSDQMDEYRHAAEKAKKTEAMLDKLKKKWEVIVEEKKNFDALAQQNSDLLDKNLTLEEELTKLSSFRPLLDSYKSQIDTLERKSTKLKLVNDTLSTDFSRATTRLKVLESERAQEGELTSLLRDRVKELEGGKMKEGDHSIIDEEGEGELSDALAGTTMMDLKITIRKLQRERAGAGGSSGGNEEKGRILVLENQLEDALRIRERYEEDYLNEHREKLVLERRMEEILEGKSSDGPGVSIALRERLNEVVDELAELRKAHTSLDVQFDATKRALTVAKSNLNLVGKDKLAIVKSLRAEVSVEKITLVEEVERLTHTLREAEDTVKMQLSQINTLLLDKVNLQSDGIDQRDKLLSREQDFGALSVTDQKTLSDLREALAISEEKRAKIKRTSAEKIREWEAERLRIADSHREKILLLESEKARIETNAEATKALYKREQQLMASVVYDYGMQTMRENAEGSSKSTSWLKLQRDQMNGSLRHA